MGRAGVVSALLISILAACGQTVPEPSASAPAVLTSTTFLADITRNLAGDRLVVESLLPYGADPHSYQPTPQDVAMIAQSKVLVINGAGYEHFIESLLENAGGGREIIEASMGIIPLEDAQAEGGVDPHMWLDPNLVMIYVENIQEGLTRFDPEGEAVYRANADAYLTQLSELDRWITKQTQQLPEDRRFLVTNHETLGYFAERYGFEVVGSVIPSFSGNAAPSARQIAEETGARVESDLHFESLTEGAPAATYIDMMKHNVMTIVDALK